MRVAIVGLGLIGSSLGRALRARGHEVVGWDLEEGVRRRARQLGAVAKVVGQPSAVAQGAEVVVLAVPVGAMGRAAAEIAGGLGPETTLTDVGSVKQSVIAEVQAVLPRGVIFIPGHPIAGDAHSGPEAARPDLFHGCVAVLCPPRGEGPEAEGFERVRRMWEEVGARVLTLDPAQHDRALAVTSHLPHAVSYALAAAVGAAAEDDDRILGLSAGGLRDTLRIAGSSPLMWRDIFLHNSEPVLQQITRYQEALEELRRLIEAGDRDGLLLFLHAASMQQRRFGEGT